MNQPTAQWRAATIILGEKFADNHSLDPGVRGQAATGSLSQNPVYDAANNVTIFTDSAHSWEVNELKNMIISLPKSNSSYPVFSNTATH
jgi:hypothetical protein